MAREPGDGAGYLLAVPVQQLNGAGPQVAGPDERHELCRQSVGDGSCGYIHEQVPDVELPVEGQPGRDSRCDGVLILDRRHRRGRRGYPEGDSETAEYLELYAGNTGEVLLLDGGILAAGQNLEMTVPVRAPVHRDRVCEQLREGEHDTRMLGDCRLVLACIVAAYEPPFARGKLRRGKG